MQIFSDRTRATKSSFGSNAKDPQIISGASVDYALREGRNTIFADTITTQRNDDFSLMFRHGVLGIATRSTVTGNGTNTVVTQKLHTETNGGISSARVESKRRIFYRSGHESYAEFTARFSDVAGSNFGLHADDEALIGPHDAESGYMIGYHGGANDTKSFVAVRRGPLGDDIVEQKDFNLDKLDGSGLSSYVINTDALNIFRVTWGYLGTAPAYFEVYAGHKIGWIPFHAFDLSNVTQDVVLPNPHLPIAISTSTNDAQSDSVFIESGSWNGGSCAGKHDASDLDIFAYNRVVSNIGTTPVNMITLRLKPTFGGAINNTPIDLRSLRIAAFTVLGNATVTFLVHLNSVLANTNFQDFHTDSAVQYDTQGQIITNGLLRDGKTIIEGDSKDLEWGISEIEMGPNESLTISAFTNTNTATGNMLVRWGERV